MREPNRDVLTAVDLFCGAGGISCGLERAGFKVLAGVDNEPAYLQSFEGNFPNAVSLSHDLSKVHAVEVLEAIGVRKGSLDLLAGGPPCQGFSKNVPRKNRCLEDPKNQLVAAFLRFAEASMPRFILMENVAEMQKGFSGAYTDLLLETLQSKHLGYTVTHRVLDAPEFGIPQRRRRAFFLASRDGEPLAFPAPTHSKTKDSSDLFAVEAPVTVWEALGDLPALEHGTGVSPCAYPTEPQNGFQRWARQGSEKIYNHVARKLQPIQFERLSSLEPGQGLRDLPEHLRVKSGYSGAYGRLTKSMIAPTITRWVFHPGSGRFGHPVEPRVITVREAARLQAFPDTFRFTGTYIQQSHQVGNAVPPLLAEKIGLALIAQST